MKKKGRRLSSERGQIMAEYVMMLVMAIAITGTLFLLWASLMEHGWRIAALIGWENY